MNQLLYQSTILRRSYLADSELSLDGKNSNSNPAEDNGNRLYDSDEFDYCTTEDDDDEKSVDGERNGGKVDEVVVVVGGGGSRDKQPPEVDQDIGDKVIGDHLQCESHSDDDDDHHHHHHHRALSAAESDRTSSDEGKSI